MTPLPPVTTADILASRGAKHATAVDRPYASYVEPERTAAGRVEPVATLLLSNRECPFRCAMCDLWKNTLDNPTPPGAVAAQVDWALEQLPPARHIKLYNSGNFFDHLAVPKSDREQVAQRVARHETVIVENHPAFCGSACLAFAERLEGALEVAIGLETVHRPTLAWLNKRMTLEDYQAACLRLADAGIATRAFVLLRPPGMTNEEGVAWAARSVDFAFQQGARCAALVPVRAGNGLMDRLQRGGHFTPPSLAAIEDALDAALKLADASHRVFMDLWDLEQFASCRHCLDARRKRLRLINQTQSSQRRIDCSFCATA